MSWAEVVQTGRVQHGAVASWQGTALVGATVFHRRVRTEAWARPHPKVTLLPGAPWDDLARISAALLAVGGQVWAARETALYLAGVVDRPPRRVHLVIPWSRRRPDLRGVVVTRSRTLLPGDGTTLRRLASTTVPRAFLDLAASPCPDRRLRALVIDAVQRRRATLGEIGQRAARARGATGRPRLLGIVAGLDPACADSILAQAVYERLIEEGLEPDPVPATIPVGGRLLHPDVTLRRWLVAIECDGLGFHADRESLERDHRKHNAYLVAGWRVVRIGWDRFDHDWEGFVAELRALAR